MADRTVVVELKAAVGQFNAGVASAAASTSALAGSQKAAQRGMNATSRAATGAGRNMSKLGVAATGMRSSLVGLAPAFVGVGGIALALKASAGAAIEYESAFAGVRKTVEGTPAQLADISQGLRDMSIELGTPSVELAGIAEAAGQLGVETNDVLGFTEGIAKLAETTNIVGEEGARNLARFMNITGESADGLAGLSDIIVHLGNNFATTEGEILEFGMRIAGAGTAVGMSSGEILAMGTALSSVGIRAEAGGTAISRIMIDMSTAVEEGGDKLGIFAEVADMTSSEFASAFRDDAAGAIEAFIVGLADMRDSGEDVTGTLAQLDLDERRVMDTLLRASVASDTFTSALEEQGIALEEGAALTDEHNKRMDTTEKRMDRAKAAVHEFGRELGEGLLPIIGDVAEGLVDLMDQTEEYEAIISKGNVEKDTGFFSDLNAFAGALSPFTITEQEAIDQVEQEKRMRENALGLSQATAPVGVAGNSAEAANAIARTTEKMVTQQKVIEASTGRWNALAESQGGVVGMTEPVVSSAERIETSMEAQATATKNANEAFDNLMDAERAAIDPAFALVNAVQTLAGAEEEYERVMSDSEATVQEKDAAVIALAEAELGLEMASRNAGDSVGVMEGKLDEWVRTGKITEGQADAIRSRFNDAEDAAEGYEGIYRAELIAQTRRAMENLRAARALVGQIAGTHNVTISYTSRGSAVANIVGRGRVLEGTGHTGGEVRMHSGGRIGNNGTHSGGLGSDEMRAVLQRGEFVVNRQAAQGNMALLEAINSGGTAGSGVAIDKFILRAYSDRFSLQQVERELAMQGAA